MNMLGFIISVLMSGVILVSAKFFEIDPVLLFVTVIYMLVLQNHFKE